MTSTFNLRATWGPAILLVLTLTGVYSFAQLRSAERRFELAQNELVESRRLAREIAELRELPQFAALESATDESISARIDAAAAEVGLSPTTIVRIQPQSPAWIDDTPYRVRPTRVELVDVTVRELVQFSHSLIDEAGGMTVRDVRLWSSEPDSSTRTEKWSAEITLTQMTFSPKTRRP